MALMLCRSSLPRNDRKGKRLKPDSQQSHMFQRNQCSLSSHGNMSALTDRAWHENRRGRYCHSAIVLFNQTFQQRHIVAPGFRGNTSLIRRPSAASTSWQKAMTHFHHIFTFLLLCRPCYLNLDPVDGVRGDVRAFCSASQTLPLSQRIESAPIEAFDVHNERFPQLSPAALCCMFL